MAMFAAYDALSSPFAEALPTMEPTTALEEMDATAYDAKKIVETYRKNVSEVRFTHEEIKARRSKLDAFMTDITSFMDTCRMISTIANTHDIENVDSKDIEQRMKSALDAALTFKKHFILSEENAIKDLKNKEERSQANLSMLREALVKGAKLMGCKDTIATPTAESLSVSLAPSNMCPICFEKEINRVCVPCGHTLCSSCEFSVAEKCATCRRYVDMCIPIYFSL
jgi:hypothetical protein